MEEILLGTTDRSILVFIPDSASTTGAGKTGLAHTDITVSYTRVETDNDVVNTDVTSSMNALTNLTDAHNDWGWKQVSATLSPGLYRLDVADAVFASGAWYAVVQVTVTTGLAAATPKAFKLVAYNALDGVRLGLTALPNAAAAAAGGLWILGSNNTAAVTIGNLTAAAVSLTTLATSGTATLNALTVTTDLTVTQNVNLCASGTHTITGPIDWTNFSNDIIGVGLAAGSITSSTLAAGAITATAIANGAIDAATFAADVDAEILSYIVDDATRIDASALNTASVTNVPAIKAKTDSLTFTVANQVDANALSISGDTTAADNLETAFDDTAGASRWTSIVDQGTAQSATGTTIVLRAAAAFADDELIGARILITGGSAGVGQSRLITDYVSATDTATVATWTTTPSGTITYKIFSDTAAGAGSAPTAGEVADAVWDEATSGHTTSGTFGEQLKTDVDAILDDTGTAGVVVASIANNAITAASMAADASTEIATQVNTTLGGVHGTGSWEDGGGGGGGSGAYTVTVTVTDGVDPLQSAKVRLVEGASNFTGTTNASGIATFALDDETYAITITKPGYTYTPSTIVVGGAANFDEEMDAVTIPAAPADPTLCRVYGYVINSQTNRPMIGAQVQATRIPEGAAYAGGFLVGNRRTATTDADGLFQLDLVQTDEITMLDGSTPQWKVQIPAAGVEAILSLTTTTHNLGTLAA